MSLDRKVSNAVREKRRQDKLRRRGRRTTGQRPDPDGIFGSATSNRPNRPRRSTRRRRGRDARRLQRQGRA